jgi:hypothetical protein
LTQLPAALVADVQVQECVEQFATRALDICERFKPRLFGAALPLSRELHANTAGLVGVMLELAGCFRNVAGSLHEPRLHVRRNDPCVFISQGLRLVDEAFLVAGMSGCTQPGGLWQRAYQLFLADRRLEGAPRRKSDAPAAEAALHFKCLLALHALQPESLNARELVWAHDYLEEAAVAAVISRSPVSPPGSDFWIDPAEDAAPVASVRSVPPAESGLLHFSAHGVARHAVTQMDWLRTQMSEAEARGEKRGFDLLEADAPGLPVGLTSLEALSLLGRMRDRWAAPPNRGQERQPHRYSVQVCAGLRAIWDLMRRGDGAVRIAEWQVCNESRGGYAIMAISGSVGALSVGMPLAVRRDADQPWSIGLVRWIRCATPEQVDLGLQIIAQSCMPVTIGFRGGNLRLTAPALILPPEPALRRNRGILAPAGTYTSHAFSLRDEKHSSVAQARTLSLDMQTASVEFFQYEVDPYPI